MGRITTIFDKFTAGEVSELLGAQVRLEKYYQACRTLENMIVLVHGGAHRRHGFRWIKEAANSAQEVRLMPFVFSEDQAYVLEWGEDTGGNGVLRFFTEEGAVLGPVGTDLVTDGDMSVPGSWTAGTGWSVAAGVATCDGSQVADSDLEQAITVTDGDDYWVTLTISNYSAGALTVVLAGGAASTAMSANGTYRLQVTAGSGANLQIRADVDFAGDVDDVELMPEGHYQITTPYTADQLAEIKYVQSNDVLYLAHNEVAPQELKRYAHNRWEISSISFTNAPAEWGTGNYPGAVTFFEQRLCWAGTVNEPQTIWFSENGSYLTLGPLGTDDDDPMSYTIAANQVNRIYWMLPGTRLYVGTLGATWTAGASSSYDPMTPTNIRIDQQLTFGSANVQAIRINHAVLYVGSLRRTLREMTYHFDIDAHKGPRLELLAEHVTEGYIKEVHYSQDPYSVLWAVLQDGSLLSCTYLRDEDVVAWARHETAADGEVESIAVIPYNGRDQVWACIKRTVNGSDYRYIEMMTGDWGTDITDAFYVDSGLTYDGDEYTISGATNADPVVITATGHSLSNGDYVRITGVAGMTEINGTCFKVANKTANTFELKDLGDNDVDGSGYGTYTSGGTAKKAVYSVTGLDHLEGETVQVLADGSVRPDCTVSSGSITLARPASKVHAGLGYTSTLETMRLEAGGNDGTAQGKKKRVNRVVLRVYRTVGGKLGPDTDHMDRIDYASTGDTMDEAVPYRTGDVGPKIMGGSFNTHGRIVVQQDQPLPFTLLGIIPQAAVNDMAG